MSRYYSSNNNTGCFTYVILAILLGVIAFGWASCKKSNEMDYKNMTVIEKYRTGGDDSKFLVLCEDENGTPYEFENTDFWLSGKTRSTTIQGQLKEGNVYNFTTVGWRSGIGSMYPNIIEYELVEDNQEKE